MINGGIVGAHYGQGAGNGKNPISYYYGKNQTQRLGQNYSPGGSSDSQPAEFKATADETYDQGQSDLLTILSPADESNLDNAANAPDNCLLQFPAGRYNLLFQGYADTSAQGGFRVELKQIQDGTDDLLITHTTGWTSGASPARTAYDFQWTDFVVAGTERFYFLFPVMGSSRKSHYLRIEKVA